MHTSFKRRNRITIWTNEFHRHVFISKIVIKKLLLKPMETL